MLFERLIEKKLTITGEATRPVSYAEIPAEYVVLRRDPNDTGSVYVGGSDGYPLNPGDSIRLDNVKLSEVDIYVPGGVTANIYILFKNKPMTVLEIAKLAPRDGLVVEYLMEPIKQDKLIDTSGNGLHADVVPPIRYAQIDGKWGLLHDVHPRSNYRHGIFIPLPGNIINSLRDYTIEVLAYSLKLHYSDHRAFVRSICCPRIISIGFDGYYVGGVHIEACGSNYHNPIRVVWAGAVPSTLRAYYFNKYMHMVHGKRGQTYFFQTTMSNYYRYTEVLREDIPLRNVLLSLSYIYRTLNLFKSYTSGPHEVFNGYILLARVWCRGLWKSETEALSDLARVLVPLG